jgi:hypothetical protein
LHEQSVEKLGLMPGRRPLEFLSCWCFLIAGRRLIYETTELVTRKFPNDEKKKKIFAMGISSRQFGLVGQRPIIGRKGKKR